MALATSTWLMIGSAAMSAIGSMQQGAAQNKQAKFQAAVSNQQAARTREISKAEASDFRRDQQRRMARARAVAGASGIDPSSGSALLGSSDFASEVELQARRIRAGGETEAGRLDQHAELTRMAGRSAKRGGLFRAGGTLLSAAGQTFG